MKQIQDQLCEGHCAQNCGCYQNEPDMALPSKNLQSSKTRGLKEVCSTKQYANASCVLRSTPERECRLRSRSLHGEVYGDQDTERLGAQGVGKAVRRTGADRAPCREQKAEPRRAAVAGWLGNQADSPDSLLFAFIFSAMCESTEVVKVTING